MSVSFAGRGFAAQRRLLGAYFVPQRGRILLLAALVFSDIALRLVNPQIVRRFIDTAQAGGPLSVLTVAAALYLIVGLLGRLIALASAYAGLSLGWAATNRLRGDLAAHLLRLDMPFHKAHTPGELIERVDGDVSALAEFLGQMLVKVAGNALLVLGILALLYRENTFVGALLTGYTALVILALAQVGRIGIPAWTAARQTWSEVTGFLEERLAGTEDIRGIGAEAHHQRRLSALMLHLLRDARAGWLANALGHVSTNALFVAGYALGLALGAGLFLRGEVTIGGAFLIVQYIGMLARPLEEIRAEFDSYQEASAGVKRVGELLAARPDVVDNGLAGLPPGPLSVEFDRVSFRYRDGGDETPDEPDLVLRDVSFTLQAGRVLGVLGRTGSGKTTLMRLLLRLYDPEAGAIRLGGMDTREVALDELRAAVGLVTQDVQLFGASVRDNVTLFDESISPERVEAALASVGLLGWVRDLPQGLDTRLAPGGGMSAGEAQLLAFARVLLRDAGLVVLDEAASRLDPVTEARVEVALDALLGTARGEAADASRPGAMPDGPRGARRSAIVIAHRLRTVQRADDILILEGGRVAEFGAREVLAANPASRFSRLLRVGLEEALT
jgi:ABC-type multidrug transport system fused ATPase/permease subunit